MLRETLIASRQVFLKCLNFASLSADNDEIDSTFPIDVQTPSIRPVLAQWGLVSNIEETRRNFLDCSQLGQ